MLEHYFKFRSLQDLRRFVDIILNKRLFASRYNELNDPMEGVYLTDPRNREVIRLLKTEKYRTRVCSLSKDYRHTLLWAHYADSHKGCCIEVSVNEERVRLGEVTYIKDLPYIDNFRSGEELLLHKSTIWEYEDEVRLFTNAQYLNVQVHRVIFGKRVSDKDYKFYEKLIRALDPQIYVYRISDAEIITGF